MINFGQKTKDSTIKNSIAVLKEGKMAPQVQYKIYTYAREVINAVMNDLVFNQSFTMKETAWKSKVELQSVTFEISEKIKDLLEAEFTCQQGKAFATMTFELKNDSIWEATVCGNGAESYFFARMLYMALARITSGIVDEENTTLNLIEQYAAKAAIKAQISSLGFIAKASYKNGIYAMTIPVNGIKLTFSDRNPDLLCRAIGMQLRGHLKFKRD